MTYFQIKSIVVLLALVLAGGVFLWRLYAILWRSLQITRPVGKINHWLQRISGVVTFMFGQLRLFRFPLPGVAHFFIFWGFVILSLTILQAIGEGLFVFFDPEFSFPFLSTFGPLAFAQDILALGVAAAIVYALYVRLVVNPERYKGSHKEEGVRVLFYILGIVSFLIIMNAARINQAEDPISSWRPVSRAVASLFSGVSESGQFIVEEISYAIHLGIVLVFLTELPTGKHFHVVTSLPDVLLRNLDPPGFLPKAVEVNGNLGVGQVEHFRWRNALEFYTCTECGRCQEVCPAYSSGTPLSPKLLIMNLRDALKARVLSGNGQRGSSPILAGEVIAPEAVWACATCYACDQECPLFIEHVLPIVELRRYLVSEGKIDEELQDALASLGRYGNSLGKSPRQRAMWAKSITPKIKDARREPVEYLWFVGDYASYNPGVTPNTVRLAQILQKAGVDFGILYDGELNAGNDVRRVGEEGLFEILVEKNARVLGRAQFQKVFTTDPHTYNTLKNEYPPDVLNGKPVLHYTELLLDLIESGKLKLTRKLNHTVTYQDPCYLGRYNRLFDPPRQVIEATGSRLREMPHHHDKARCCGAGGGRVWIKEGSLKERPSEARVREAGSLEDVSAMVVACPKDISMFVDAVKTTGLEKRLAIRDVTELVSEAL